MVPKAVRNWIWPGPLLSRARPQPLQHRCRSRKLAAWAGDHVLLNAGHHGLALAERQPDRFQAVVALVEMQNLVHADHPVVITNDPELDLNTHAYPNGCR